MRKKEKPENLYAKILSILLLVCMCLAFPFFTNEEIVILEIEPEDTSEESSYSVNVEEIFSYTNDYADVSFTLNSSAVLFCGSDLDSQILGNLQAGEVLSLMGIYDKTVKVRRYNLDIGFIDKNLVGEEILAQLPTFEVEKTVPDELVNIIALSEDIENVETGILTLSEIFLNNTYWNRFGFDLSGIPNEWTVSITTDFPCKHLENGCEFCNTYYGKSNYDTEYLGNSSFAFTSMCSDFLFGVNSDIEKHQDVERLAIGDQIFDQDEKHSMLITNIEGSSVEVLECNRDGETCQISWGRVIKKDELLSENYIFLTRN
ncbi:MAG: hypothetical protein R3Y33_08345 [Clostridia bacterium]